MDFTQDVLIEKPIDEVAALLSDPDHIKRWHRDLVSIERVSGEPGAVGSKAVLNYDHKGRKFRLEETILEQDLPRKTVARYETTGMKHLLTTTLTAEGDGATRVRVDNDMHLSGMAKLAAPMLQGSLRKQVDKRVLDLKTWAETGELGPASDD